MVPHVEYPMTGGNAVVTVMSHRMAQPPGRARHLSAMDTNQAKIGSLYTRKTMPTTPLNSTAAATSTCCNLLSLPNEASLARGVQRLLVRPHVEVGAERGQARPSEALGSFEEALREWRMGEGGTAGARARERGAIKCE